MSLQKNSRNTYEVDPDQLKDLVQHGPNEKGEKPKSRKSRESLLKTHEQNVNSLVEGSVPIRTLVLPRPYPPSRIDLQGFTCKKMHLEDLRISERDTEELLVLRTITPPYVYSSTVTIVEDANGDVTKLIVGNLEDNPVDPILVDKSVIGIKQPCWSKQVDGDYHIRVDHPSDLVILKAEDKVVPDEWKWKENKSPTKDADQWKKEGDMMFLKKKFRKALEFYNNGLSLLSQSNTPDPLSEIDIYRKRCGVNIVLLRLDDAADDLSNAIAIHTTSSSSISSTQLADFSTIKLWLHSHSTEDPLEIGSNIPRALKELAARIKFDLGIDQPTPEYNFPVLSSYVGPLTLHVDAANYTCDTETKQTDTRGQGLYAKRAFKAGEIITAEKAFVLPGYFMQDMSSDCLLYSLDDGTASPRPGAWLFKELVQKLRWNPSLRKEFFALDDGGYWKEHGWEVAEGDEIPVDVFRIELIRRYNAFSAPTRSSDLLRQAPNSNPELRNGFWINASYINHACLPNSIRTFIGDIRFLRAARDIEAGEELTNQYVAPDIDIESRQDKYRDTWGFECTCELCVVDGAVRASVRQERRRLFEELKGMVMNLGERGTTVTSIKKIARGLRELEALYSPTEEGETDVYAALPRLALVHPTLFLTEAWRSVKNIEKMMENALRLLRNFGILATVDSEGQFKITSNSGMVNVETVRALKYLSEGYISKGEKGLSEQCIGLAKTWFFTITGAEMGFEEFFKE